MANGFEISSRNTKSPLSQRLSAVYNLFQELLQDLNIEVDPPLLSIVVSCDVQIVSIRVKFRREVRGNFGVTTKTRHSLGNPIPTFVGVLW
jgi:hypothetical protein